MFMGNKIQSTSADRYFASSQCIRETENEVFSSTHKELPNELHVYIANFLSTNDLKKIACVNRTFREVTGEVQRIRLIQRAKDCGYQGNNYEEAKTYLFHVECILSSLKDENVLTQQCFVYEDQDQKRLDFEATFGKIREQIDTLNHAIFTHTNDLKFVKLFLFFGVSPNIQNENGETLLYNSVKKGFANVVKFLIDNGADASIRDKKGSTLLHFAAASGYLAVVNVLIDCGADLDSKNEMGKTPLHCAVTIGHDEVVKALHVARADLNSKNMDRRTPLHLAAMQGRITIVEYLLLNKAESSTEDRYRKTPLDYAKEMKRHDVANLIQRQANNHC